MVLIEVDTDWSRNVGSSRRVFAIGELIETRSAWSPQHSDTPFLWPCVVSVHTAREALRCASSVPHSVWPETRPCDVAAGSRNAADRHLRRSTGHQRRVRLDAAGTEARTGRPVVEEFTNGGACTHTAASSRAKSRLGRKPYSASAAACSLGLVCGGEHPSRCMYTILAGA